MRILIIGAHGTVGGTAYKALKDQHEIITAGRSTGDIRVDLADPATIAAMYADVGQVDAVLSAAGQAKWAPFEEMTVEDYEIGLFSKLMGQVNLVRMGLWHVSDGGSITLTTGILGEQPVTMTTSAAMVNGGLHSFVKAAALEMPRGVRINVVAPGLVADSAERLGHYFPGQTPVAMDKVGEAYRVAVEGDMSGELIRVYE